MLSINRKIEDKRAVFTLEGRLDTITAPELEKELSATLQGVDDLTLDFDKLDYISSAGLRVLLTTQKILNRQGKMKIVHVNSTIMEVFEVTGFIDILTIE